jgi:diadenosine tetraphosphatase ApaH/serine/threonine PP2A family protein phosphatase
MTTPIGPAADTPDRALRRSWLEEQGEAAAARGRIRQSWLYQCEWFTLLPLALLDDELRSYAQELGIAYASDERYERLAQLLERLEPSDDDDV